MAALTTADIEAIADRHPLVFAGSLRKQAAPLADRRRRRRLSGVRLVVLRHRRGARRRQLGHCRRLSRRLGFLRGSPQHRVRRRSASRSAIRAFRPTARTGSLTGCELDEVVAPGIGRRIVMDIGRDRVEVAPGLVTATRGDETLVIEIGPDEKVNAQGSLPAWAEQKSPGDKIVLDFGFSGRVDDRGRRTQGPASLPRLGKLRLRRQLAVLGKVARRSCVADRLRRADQTRHYPTQPLPGTTSSTMPNGSMATSG